VLYSKCAQSSAHKVIGLRVTETRHHSEMSQYRVSAPKAENKKKNFSLTIAVLSFSERQTSGIPRKNCNEHSKPAYTRRAWAYTCLTRPRPCTIRSVIICAHRQKKKYGDQINDQKGTSTHDMRNAYKENMKRQLGRSRVYGRIILKWT
jgi:hypothetical protein